MLGKRQEGIALIQVIITTSIILLLTIFYLTMAKSQVIRAQALQDRTQAYLAGYSSKNRVLFGLMTKPYHELQEQGWNFHGEPFVVNENATVQLQDLSGLYSLSSMTQGGMLEKLLAQTIPLAQAKTISTSILDWADKDNVRRGNGAEQNDYPAGVMVRNGPIQTFTELAYINGMTIEAEQVLIENTTVQPTPSFNLMTAPQPVLAAFLGDESKAATVAKIKNQAGFSAEKVEQITQSYQGEQSGYIIGPGFRIITDSQVGESYVGKMLEVQVIPYRPEPMILLSQMARQLEYVGTK